MTPAVRFHHCDDKCACPVCGEPPYYSATYGIHACSDPTCPNAHGIEATLPGYPANKAGDHFLATDLTRDAQPVEFTVTQDGKIYTQGLQVGQTTPDVVKAMVSAAIGGVSIEPRMAGKARRREILRDLIDRGFLEERS